MDKNDHDLLICIDVKLKGLKEQVANHLKHHWAITIGSLGAAMSAFTALVVLLLRK